MPFRPPELKGSMNWKSDFHDHVPQTHVFYWQIIHRRGLTMERRRPAKNRLSLVANILIFILGVFTYLFVNPTAGIILIILSAILYVIYVWLMRQFERVSRP